MKKNFFHSAMFCMAMASCMGSMLTSCSDDDEKEKYQLKKEDISIKTDNESGNITAVVDQLIRIEVNSVNDENIVYQWFLGEEMISSTKNLEYMFNAAGEYTLTLRAASGTISYDYNVNIVVKFEQGITPTPDEATAYVTKVLAYVPAPGQFVNTMPQYKNGDTQDSMNEKVLNAIGNGKDGLITLGGFGGYVIVGFDHTIENKAELCDFRIKGNSFTGSAEPGIILVAYDQNKNGKPDDNEWYEIAGSAYENGENESWYNDAVKAGNDVKTYKNYEMTYYAPKEEPNKAEKNYIKWEDNNGQSGYKEKNAFHSQPYFPQWIENDKLIFKGTRLPQNGINTSTNPSSPYFVLYEFKYGYADNAANSSNNCAIDIDWAVNAQGQKIQLPGVDFIKIYTGVNQENGWLGENSTEVGKIEDLHVLNENIPTIK